MSEDDNAAARKLANENVSLELFALDMLLAAGGELIKIEPGRENEPDFGPEFGRFIALTTAFHNGHKAMVEHRSNAEGTPARNVWQACALLAAEAGLLAAYGDANWPYKPAEVNRG